MKYLVKKRIIPVSFRNYPPQHVINTALFEVNAYTDIMQNGLRISPLKIIHAASVHYRGRYRRSASLRFINAFIELFPSLSEHHQSSNLCIGDTESSEFQGRSSEVLGVGLTVNLATKLFNVNYNRIIPIEMSGKRCDLQFSKNGGRYLLESRGRKNSSQINGAIVDTFAKKQVNPALPQYGFVSHIPRDGSPTSVTIVDPDGEDIEIRREKIIADILDYYARYAALCGFWRLADLLDQRVDSIRANVPLTEFEAVPLDFENVVKLGRGFTISLHQNEFAFFRAKDKSIGFLQEYDNHIFFCALDGEIMNILIQQNYNELLSYTFTAADSLSGSENEKLLYSANNDGSILVGIPKKEFTKNVDQ